MIGSCAKIYYSPDANLRASSHEVIAIAPPVVSIAARRNIDAEAIKEQQITESTNFQMEMYSWLLRRKMQSRLFVEIQDVATTNAKLAKAGYFDDNPMSPFEICEVLGVDGLMTSNYSLTKPMSEEGAIASGILLGDWGTTNRVIVTLEIHDKATKKLLWNYNHKMAGGIDSSPAQLVNELLRDATVNMPYSR